jgi:hypothetical protein
LLAESLTRVGEFGAAIDIAGRLLTRRDLSVQQLCRARATMGHCHFRNGSSEQGVEHYRAGIDLAENSNEFVEEARLRVQLFRDQVRWVGPQPAVAGLSVLRRKMYQ